jgi:tetratricopeptide (TPR) repeat protein
MAGSIQRLADADPRAWLRLGASLLAGQRLEEAGECLDRAIAMEPTYLEALLLRARVHLDAGEPVPATDLLERAVRQPEAGVEAWNNLGVACLRAAKMARAREAADVAAELAPTDPVVRLNRSVILAASGEVSDALVELCETVSLAPQLSEAWRHKASLHLRRGQLREAHHDFQAAARIGWGKGRQKRDALLDGAAGVFVGLLIRLGVGEGPPKTATSGREPRAPGSGTPR